jgi:phage terminase small subunit
MPVLTNPRQELFVLKLVEGKSQLAAYEAAGFTNCKRAASHLFRRPHIAARRTELLAEVAVRTGVTAEQLILKAEAVFDAAMAAKQLNAAVAAVREIGILSGVRVEKRAKVQQPERTLREMSDEELMAIAAGGQNH